VLYGAAQVDPSGDADQGNARERLYALYVEYALGRTAPDSPRARTSREPFLRWLGWLAVWMKAGNQVELVSKDLENLWAVSKHGIWPSGLFHSLIAGLAAGAIGGREIGLIVALGGAVLFRISQFVWQTYLRRGSSVFWRVTPDLIVLCSSASLNALAYALAATLVSPWFHGAHTAPGLGVRFGLAAAICSALSAVVWFIELHTIIPRMDGRSRSFKLLHFLVGAAPLLLVAALFQRAASNSGLRRIFVSLAVGWISSSLVSLAVRRHVVHLSLWMRRAAPLRYARGRAHLPDPSRRQLRISSHHAEDYVARVYGPSLYS